MLMDLGELLAHRHGPIGADFRELRHRAQELMRTFVQNRRIRVRCRPAEGFGARLVPREEALEHELARIQRRHRDGCDGRARPWDAQNFDALLRCQLGKRLARVGNDGRARVRHKRDVLPCKQPVHKLPRALGTGMLVKAHKLVLDAQIVEQLCRVPRVLRRDAVHLVQDARGAHRHVLQIADRRRNDI